MIDSEKSGVLFTCDPVKETADEYLISGVYGVGEGLVSGQMNADNYWVDAKTGNVTKTTIEHKEAAFVRGKSGHCEQVAIAIDKQDAPCLSNDEVNNLFQLAKKITQL